MITSKDIKTALISLMKKEYSTEQYKYYSGLEVIEGYSKPSFFTELDLISTKMINRNIRKYSYMFSIEFFTPKADEVNMLEMQDKLTEIFELGFSINERFIVPENVETSFSGKENNILNVEFTFEFFQEIEQEETELMKEYSLIEKFNGENK